MVTIHLVLRAKVVVLTFHSLRSLYPLLRPDLSTATSTSGQHPPTASPSTLQCRHPRHPNSSNPPETRIRRFPPLLRLFTQLDSMHNRRCVSYQTSTLRHTHPTPPICLPFNHLSHAIHPFNSPKTNRLSQNLPHLPYPRSRNTKTRPKSDPTRPPPILHPPLPPQQPPIRKIPFPPLSSLPHHPPTQPT